MGWLYFYCSPHPIRKLWRTALRRTMSASILFRTLALRMPVPTYAISPSSATGTNVWTSSATLSLCKQRGITDWKIISVDIESLFFFSSKTNCTSDTDGPGIVVPVAALSSLPTPKSLPRSLLLIWRSTVRYVGHYFVNRYNTSNIILEHKNRYKETSACFTQLAPPWRHCPSPTWSHSQRVP